MDMITLGLVLRSLLATLEMALPTSCGGCGAPGGTWCPACEAGVALAASTGGAQQVRPSPCPQGCPPTWAATSYDGVARVALVAYKDGDRRDLVSVLAPMLTGAMTMVLVADPSLAAALASGRRPVLVVPVPSAPAAVRRRGDAPLEVLTRIAARQCARPESELLVSPVLRLRRRVADQAGLNHRQRAANLERAMKVHPRWAAVVRGSTCLLTDDVMTTGATLVEASRALYEGGAGHVAAAAVAATRRNSTPPR